MRKERPARDTSRPNLLFEVGTPSKAPTTAAFWSHDGSWGVAHLVGEGEALAKCGALARPRASRKGARAWVPAWSGRQLCRACQGLPAVPDEAGASPLERMRAEGKERREVANAVR